MKEMARVYVFNIWFDNDHYMQTRLVLAYTEEEAESKLNAYREQLINNGGCNFVYVYQGIGIDGVII